MPKQLEEPTAAALDVVFDYHERTKHHFNRYARSLGYMDWATQPDPFRRYEGASLYLFPFSERDESPNYETIYRDFPEPKPVTLENIAQLFEHSLAISAHKQYEDTGWSLRCNPSSGNLHPTEGYLITRPLDALAETAGVYHYAPKEHGLECRASIDSQVFTELVEGFPQETFLCGLTSIHWREAWKYGERAFRYCQHDCGHAIAALSIAAAGLGWRAVLLDGLAGGDVARLLGVHRPEDQREHEAEEPECILAIVPSDAPSNAAKLARSTIDAIADGDWTGKARPLSSSHVAWNVIDDVAVATVKPQTVSEVLYTSDDTPAATKPHQTPLSLWEITKQRRSAVATDGETGITRDAFYTMMERVMPRNRRTPWHTWPYPPAIDLGIFVHLVDGLVPGLYYLVRDPNRLEMLRNATKPQYNWTKPPECPGNLPLYFLAEGDCRRLAAQVSCLQDIAGMGAFSLGMIAGYERAIERYGPWYYRRLFWETGMIGQVLYLEAEAAGIRSTGIGCYFDDPVHQVFGFEGRAFQSLYHFTVGGHVEDTRLTTNPPYTKERRAASGWR